jgi:hypothetical protein
VAKTLSEQIEIDASKERVWAVLIDFPAYPEWNPFLKSVKGEPREGTRLDVFFQPPGAKGITMHPELLSVVPSLELKWLGHLGVPGIFDGEHQLRIEDTSAGSLFVQQETFRGLLVPFAGKQLEQTRRGFEQMNRALKERVEAQPSPKREQSPGYLDRA